MKKTLWKFLKKLLIPIMLVAILCSVAILPLNSPVLATGLYSGGSGTSLNPYLISTEADVNSLASYLHTTSNSYTSSTYFVLTNNITLTSSNFTPIGTKTDPGTGIGQPFNCHFNGNGYIISNLSITGTSDICGFFGYTSGAYISNLGLTNVSVTGGSKIGGLVGFTANNGTNSISNCYVTGTITSTTTNGMSIGGLIGLNNVSGTNAISNCYFTGTVTGSTTSSYVGGLVGTTEGGTFNNCFTGATVTGNQYVGGLAGSSSDLSLSYCYTTGNVVAIGTGSRYLGGLLGSATIGGTGSTIQHCYVTGSVTGTNTSIDVGGLIGNATGLSSSVPYPITYCYTTGSVTGGAPTSSSNAGDTGGLIGTSGCCAITYCYTTGAVTGGTPDTTNYYYTYTGGLIGISSNDTKIEHCWATGAVTTGIQVGGLIGHPNNDGDIMYCFATGNVDGISSSVNQQGGGLIGYSYANTIANCYATGNVSNSPEAGSLIGHSRLGTTTNCYASAANLDMANNDGNSSWVTTFSGCYSAVSNDPTTVGMITTNSSTYSGWDFTNIWTTNGNTAYPFLKGLVTIVPNGGYYLSNQTVNISPVPSLPAGETLYYTTDGSTPGTGSLTGPLTFTVNAPETVKASIYDAAATPKWYNVNIAVFNAPLAVAAEPPSGYVNVLYSFNFTTTGGNGTYTWTQVAGTLPTGLTFNAVTGVISGTPTAGGQYNFTMQVKDSSNAIMSQNFTVNITGSDIPFAWGDNGWDQLGVSYLTTSSSNTPVQVTGLTGVTAVSAGYRFTLALKSDGTVWAWGDNGFGELGNNSTTPSYTPVQVEGSGSSGFLTGVIAVSAGSYHCLALKSDGTVWAWGDNSKGELGINTSTSSSKTPVQVGSLSNVTAIAAGDNYFSLALKSDGTVWAWGYNFSGQLGNNDNTYANSYIPVEVGGSTVLSGITAIDAGYSHSLALKSDGSVWSWGDNSKSELGMGDPYVGSENHPYEVVGTGGTGTLSGITAISAGELYSLALDNSSHVWSWGSNSSGQLGTNASLTYTTASPVEVHGINNSGNLSGITAISAGTTGTPHILALSSDGTVCGWGSNGDGALGGVSSGCPELITGVAGAVAVSAGADHSVAIMAPLQGKIVVYSSTTGGGPFQIYIMNADGSNRTQLTFDSGDYRDPCISPDGTKIAYIKWGANQQLWVMNSDGFGQTLLDNPPSYGDDNPSWSPDGSKVVFQSDRTGSSEIYIINASGTGLTAVSGLPTGSDNTYPSFSPNGSKIIFESGGINLYSINLDGSNSTLMYTNSSQMLHAKMAPDGSKITFDVESTTLTVYSINPDGSGKTSIATGAEPAWSPDGKYIVFYGGSLSTSGLYIMNPSGKVVSQISSGNDNDPSWSQGLVTSVGSASTLSVSGFPNPCTAGTAGSITVTAKDSGGNTVTGYTGTVHFTSSDSVANLPSNYPFTTADYGSHTFTGGVTFNTVGTQSVTAADIANTSITGTQSGITVNSTSSTTTTTSSTTTTSTTTTTTTPTTTTSTTTTTTTPTTTTSTTTTTTTPTTTTTTAAPVVTLSRDATLSNLAISPGMLSPGFNSTTTFYVVNVDNSVNAISVMPTVNQANAAVTVNGYLVTSGSFSGGMSLYDGDNTIIVLVTAQDGITKNTYTIRVTRAAATTTTQSQTIVTVTVTPTTTTATTTPITTTLPPGTTNLNGDVNSSGRFTSTATASSADGNVTVTIPAGVTGLTASGAPITQISITPITSNRPAPPTDAAAVGLYFDIQPSGSTFSSDITITVPYDPGNIPAGSSPYIAWYNPATGQWEQLHTVSIDTVNHTITASVDHFSTFAILANLFKTTTSSAAGTTTKNTNITTTAPTTTTKSSVNGGNGGIIGIIIGAVIVLALLIFIVMRVRKAPSGKK